MMSEEFKSLLDCFEQTELEGYLTERKAGKRSTMKLGYAEKGKVHDQ